MADAGRVVPESDQPAWTATLGALLADESLRRDLSARGEARARDVYDWPIVARRFLDFFEEVRGPDSRR